MGLSLDAPDLGLALALALAAPDEPAGAANDSDVPAATLGKSGGVAASAGSSESAQGPNSRPCTGREQQGPLLRPGALSLMGSATPPKLWEHQFLLATQANRQRVHSSSGPAAVASVYRP